MQQGARRRLAVLSQLSKQRPLSGLLGCGLYLLVGLVLLWLIQSPLGQGELENRPPAAPELTSAQVQTFCDALADWGIDAAPYPPSGSFSHLIVAVRQDLSRNEARQLAETVNRAFFAEFKSTTKPAVTTYVYLVPGEIELAHQTTPRP